VLVDVVPRLEPDGLRRIREFMQAHIDGFASLEEAAAAVARYLLYRPRPAKPRGLKRNLRAGADGCLYWHWDSAFIIGTKRPDVAAQSERIRSAARRIRVPVLMLRGQISDVVSRDGFLSELFRTVAVSESAWSGRRRCCRRANAAPPGENADKPMVRAEKPPMLIR